MVLRLYASEAGRKACQNFIGDHMRIGRTCFERLEDSANPLNRLSIIRASNSHKRQRRSYSPLTIATDEWFIPVVSSFVNCQSTRDCK